MEKTGNISEDIKHIADPEQVHFGGCTCSDCILKQLDGDKNEKISNLLGRE